MMRQASTAPAHPFESETFLRQQALESQQVRAINRLVEEEAQRNSLAHRLVAATGTDKQEIGKALSQSDAEIAGLKETIANTRQQLLELQGAPVVAGPVFASGSLFPPQAERVFGMTRTEFGSSVGLVLLFPLMVAFAVRIVRRGTFSPTRTPEVDDARFTRLEQAVESVAIEIERIGEAQRFSAKLLAERQADEVATRK
jgi:hypothetical protein